jgi:hypothetical protein
MERDDSALARSQSSEPSTCAVRARLYTRFMPGRRFGLYAAAEAALAPGKARMPQFRSQLSPCR